MESSSEEISTSRKRQHSRSKSRSKSPSIRTNQQDLKRTKVDTEVIVEKDTTNDSIRLKLKDVSVNNTNELSNCDVALDEKSIVVKKKNEMSDNESNTEEKTSNPDVSKMESVNELVSSEISSDEKNINTEDNNEIGDDESKNEDKVSSSDPDSGKEGEDDEKQNDSITLSSDGDTSAADIKDKVATSSGSNTPTRKLKQDTPNKKLTPKQLQKRLEIEKKQQEKQKEKEDKLKKKLEEKLKRQEIKDKELEEKQKEKEMRKKEKEEKEEKKRKEREEKEQKRKEKEEQKRKEREEEKQKKLQEIEEKNKEKLKEEEKKQKAAAAFVNFFVAKKPDETQDERKTQTSNFLQFEVKSDMKLPLPRREVLSIEEKQQLDSYLETQNEAASYLKDISSGKPIGKSLKTWPYEESNDDDVIIVGLGETICEDNSSLQRHKAKFLHFHENRRPAYCGTWRKKSKFVKPRKPTAKDKEILNYEEDSDDDWEEEEQGESLNGSEDEADKENEDEKDDYEVDNDFFVPHGHLSEDEVDDEETTRLSPDSLKQKLRLLKEEFDHDMQSKTHKLKPRSIGCIWYNKDGSNVVEAVDRYLQPLTIIARGQIVIKKRIEIFVVKERKNKVSKELAPELIPPFLRIVHGSSNKKNVLLEQFLTDIEKTGANHVSKGMLIRTLRKCASWEKYRDADAKRYKFRWSVHQDLREKYKLETELDSK